MTLTVDAYGRQTVAPLPQRSPTPPVPDPHAEAARILKVGERGPSWTNWSGTDDYDARMDEFARTIEALPDQASRQALLAEVLKQDDGATRSWLQVGRINHLVADSRISQTERGALAETFAGAYNDGLFAAPRVPANSSNPAPDWQNTPGGSVSQEVFDGMIWNYSSSSYSGPQGTFDNARQVSDFLSFIDSSSGPEVAQLRREYSEHLINDYALNDNVDPSRRAVAAGVAAQIMAGDPARPETVADVLSALTPAQRQTFLDQASHANGYLSADMLRGAVDYVNVQEGDIAAVAQPDGVSAVFSAIAVMPAGDAQAQALAAEFARLPQTDAGLFKERGNPAYQARVDSMTALFANHADAVLDVLTDYDRTGARNVGSDEGTNLEQYEVNGRDLGALLELTLFNPDSGNSGAVRSAVLDYAQDLRTQINGATDANATGFDEAASRLAMLSAASSDAINQGFSDLRGDIEAQKALIGFAVDLALAAVPAGKLVGNGAKGVIAELLPAGRVRTAVEGLSGQIIDKSTGKLTDAAKEQLYAALGQDHAELIGEQEAQDLLEATLVTGISNEAFRNQVVERADRLADDLGELH